MIFVMPDQIVFNSWSVTVNVVEPAVYTNMVLLLFSAGMWALHWGVPTVGLPLEKVNEAKELSRPDKMKEAQILEIVLVRVLKK